MVIRIQCDCGRRLKAQDRFAGRRAECPTCGRMVQIPDAETSEDGPASADTTPPGDSPAEQAEPMEITDYLDPPQPAAATTSAEPDQKKISVSRLMLEAMLNPRSLQWMLMIGGGLCVLGVIVYLVSRGIFEDAKVLAVAMGIASLAVLAAGWFVTLKTKYRMAGQALTFLGCVVAPLNLWFYHAQGLITVNGHLWVGGVVCCLLYAATVYVLRDSLFMYAIEGGATLTVLLLLAELDKFSDGTYLSLFFMAMGLISIHAERAFADDTDGTILFSRKRYGLPLFWSGHAQLGISLVILLGSQIFLGWLLEPAQALFHSQWTANPLAEKYLLAGGLWLTATYLYLYSDIVVRRIGVYIGLAGVSFVMAEVTLLLGFDLPAEWIIAVLAVTALAINVVHSRLDSPSGKLDRVTPPIAFALSTLPVVMGLILHIRATSRLAEMLHWTFSTGWEFVIIMLIVAVSNRVSAYLARRVRPRWSAGYFFLSAAAVLIGLAGLLRVLGLTEWSAQAPLMMLVPIAYILAARLWRGHTAERPLGWVAQAATAVILGNVFVASLKDLQSFVPMERQTMSLLLGLVFAEAALFYVLAGLFRKRSANVYLAAAAACGALWQFLGYYGIDSNYNTLLYAGLGVVGLIVARTLGLEQVSVYHDQGGKTLVTRGRGLAAYQCGNGILVIDLLAAFMQGLAGLAAHKTTGLDSTAWFDIAALATTALASLIAVGIVPAETWRRVYTTGAVALAAVTFLRLNLLIDLNGWQKLEIFCVAIGLLMLLASHVARFRHIENVQDDLVSLGLLFGSILTTTPLVIAFAYHRFYGSGPSLYDEMGLLTVTILMLVTGVSWQTKSTTLLGGGSLLLYLVVLVISVAYRPEVAIGVYLAVGGALVFAVGIVLSVYRDKLMELPDRIAQREGLFRVLNWR